MDTIHLLGWFVAALISYLAYLSYTPKFNRKSPAFTTDTVPLIGSWGFMTRKYDFYKKSVKESKTGNFSCWLGKHHMIGLSGEANRKAFLNEQRLDFAASTEIFKLGPEFVPPVHAIYDNSFHNGRSYFVRRLLDLQKSELLVKRLPRVTADARAAFDALAKSPSNVVNPTSMCYRLVVMQDCRILCCDEISDDPKLLKSCIDHLMTLRTAIDLQGSFLPWLPSKEGFRRRYATYSLNSLIAPIVHNRMKKGSPRKEDALQTLVDNGDSKEYILRFLPNQLFIASANAGYLVGAMLNIVAHHAYWQEKIFVEIKATALKHSKAKGAPLVDQLDSIPLDAWESSFPSIDLCYKEAVRMWIAFPMLRLNVASEPLPIPRTSEVIPPGAFVAYHTADVHYNEELYPNPTKYDPERFLEGREEFKRQNFGFVGWGAGCHPCPGMRWAKLQQTLILAYALAKFEWTGCHADGSPNHMFDRKIQIAPSTAVLPQGLYCKYTPRKET
ncbi:cytochrome P450 [Usnea florida]